MIGVSFGLNVGDGRLNGCICGWMIDFCLVRCWENGIGLVWFVSWVW